MLDFLAVGDVMLDVKLPAPAALRRAHHGAIESGPGGSAVNAARAATRLGATAAVAGAVGDDTLGKILRMELEAAGVTPLLDVVPGAATGTVVYGPAIVADRGANADYVPHDLPAARVTLVSGYLSAEGRARALELASGLRAIDLQGVLADETNADVVLGPQIDLDLDHAVVCSTLGADGAEARRGEERARVRPPRVLNEPVIGAGDAFATGFLLALVEGASLEDALGRGCGAVTG